jgi:hypothetical protein
LPEFYLTSVDGDYGNLVETSKEEVEQPRKRECVVEKVGDAHDHERQHGDRLQAKKTFIISFRFTNRYYVTEVVLMQMPIQVEQLHDSALGRVHAYICSMSLP